MAADEGSSIHVARLSASNGGDQGSALSWFQERMWIHYQRSPDSTSYNLPFILLVEGDLDVAAMEQSLSQIVARHESLRTRYRQTDEGEPEQLVAPPEALSLVVIPVDHAQLLARLEQHLEHRFDLTRGPIFIVSLLRLAADRHLLLFNVHHIAADAWSLRAVFLGELQSAYAAFSRSEPPALPPLTMQYRQYAAWQRATDASAHLAYWQRTLEGYEDTLELPTVHPRKAKSGATSGSFAYRYSAEFAQNLERFSRLHGCTIFMSLLAALGVTLSRYANKDDLCIGTTTSNRTDVALEPLIGFFINILPLRLRIDEQSSVGALLKAVRAQVLGAFEHAVPFERILLETDVARRGGENPLVPVVMRHQNFPQTSLRAALPGGLKLSPFPGPDEKDPALRELFVREHVPARCELELSYSGGADELVVEVVYASDLYDRETVERLLAQHQRVLTGMFGDAEQRVLDLPLLRDADVEKLLEQYNRAKVTRPPAASFAQRFDAQVDLSPGAVACWDERGAWSYVELGRHADQLAHALSARGVKRGELVAVCLDRSAKLLATLLGVWKAGAAYVPLDPAYPPAYLRQILDDARPTTVVCADRHRPLLELGSARCLTLEDVWGGAAPRLPTTAPVLRFEPDALAYVMYTSGSTGTPKGVRVPHRQLDNWLGALEASVPFEAGEVVAQKTTFVFAVAVKELFAGLLNGCPQVFIGNDTVRDPAAFVNALAEHRVTRLNLGPSHLASVIEYLRSSGRRLPALKICITAGEPLPAALVLAFRELLPGARLLNNYGCTELNDITYYDTASFDGRRDFVPIGTPIANTKLYVLDRQGRLAPEGVAGELHVASVSVPDGYHGRDELTAERFLPNPFGADPGPRLYNTGDVVKYLPDGSLDFVGRWDFQVKVRGFRVDVRHVEKALGDFEGIQGPAVVSDGERLIAFYTNAAGKAAVLTELREFLQARLPAYMVPDAFVLLDAMPQLQNGKLNRRALLEARGELQQSSAYDAPATATERVLARIWGLVVNVPAERIGRQTHFFDIGGHSLSAMRALARIKDSFRVELGVSEIFEAPRLQSVAAAIEREVARLPQSEHRAQPSYGAQRAKPQAGWGLLSGKVALVTGASRGIGLSTALLLAEHGASVAINYRDSEAQARGVKARIEAEGGVAEVFGADVTRADDVEELVVAIHRRFEHIDVLVANAHMNFRNGPFITYDWKELERKVTDELKALFFPCQAIAPEMLRRKNGSIVAVSSTLSRRGTVGFLGQSTAKGAVDSFVRTLAAELGPGGVRVNAIAPGVTLTDAALPMSAIEKERIAANCPMRRNGLPEDMAGAVLFLASDLSRFMSGTYLPVDGGFTML